MKPIKLKIETKTQKYPIIIGSNLITNLSKIIKNNSLAFNQCLLVVDKNVPKKFITKIKNSLKKKKIYIYSFNASEANKNFVIINKILEILLNKNFSRDDCLISIGGGITGDVSGFASSIFKRGMKFINIPTTLLSQVDSSIGGKTGINSHYGKNLIGSFYQPNLVISDVDFLKSLPKFWVVLRHFHLGYVVTGIFCFRLCIAASIYSLDSFRNCSPSSLLAIFFVQMNTPQNQMLVQP